MLFFSHRICSFCRWTVYPPVKDLAHQLCTELTPLICARVLVWLACIFFFFLQSQFSLWVNHDRESVLEPSLLTKHIHSAIASFPFTTVWVWNSCSHFFSSPLFWSQSNEILVPTTPLKQLLPRSPLPSILLDAAIKSQLHLTLSEIINTQYFYLLLEILPSLLEYHCCCSSQLVGHSHPFLCWLFFILPTSKYSIDPGLYLDSPYPCWLTASGISSIYMLITTKYTSLVSNFPLNSQLVCHISHSISPLGILIGFSELIFVKKSQSKYLTHNPKYAPSHVPHLI